MNQRTVFEAALVLVLGGVLAPSASASCIPPKSVSTYNQATGAFVYFHTTVLFSPGVSLLGKIWSPSGDHTGTCNDGNQLFLYFGVNPAAGDIGVFLSLGEPCVVGCPSGSLSLQIAASKTGGPSQTIVAKVAETASLTNFDFSTLAPADLQLGDYPRPRVISSSRAGTMVNLLLRLDSSATLFRNGTGGDIAGYNIVSASSTSDPGPNASDYSLRSFVSAPGGAAGTGSATVDCANASKNEWIAFQLVSAIGGPSPAVGPRVRVTCDPALANPKYNLVPKRGMGTGISD